MAADDSDIQRQLIAMFQDGLPIRERPYAEAASTLGITEAALLQSLRDMLADGGIRRIGVVPNHYALGYSHNLMSVWDVDDAQVQRLGRAVAALPFVSHCYLRPRHAPDWPYNLFAMVHGKSEAEGREKLQHVEALLGDACRDRCQLKSRRILKKSGLRIQREVA